MSENFRARRLRVEILRQIAQRNSFGELLFSYEAACQVWAELHGGGRITARFFGECFPGWRVKIGDELRTITAVIDRRGKTRLVELQTEPIKNHISPRWFCPRDRADEQQSFRAFRCGAANQAGRITNESRVETIDR